MVTRKPRIVIIGAGMAGLAAATKLHFSAGNRFELLVVEAGPRIGGRISSSEFGGARVEHGATWIHGIEGNPVYKMASETGSLSCNVDDDDEPWEGMDGGIPGDPITVAEGGLRLGPYLVDPVSRVFNELLDSIQVLQGNGGDAAEHMRKNSSVGEFLRQGLDKYKGSSSVEWKGNTNNNIGVGNWGGLEALQEAIFAMHECRQRTDTSADDLGDLDYASEREYVKFPGEEITIPNGYSSVVQSLAAALPLGMIQLGRKLDRIEWRDNPYPPPPPGIDEIGRRIRPVNLHFGNGSTLSVDHVILTVSLGVLKHEIQRESSFFTPPLPDSKAAAISRLGYGTVNKVFLQTNQTEETRPSFPFLQMVFHPSDSKLRNPNIPAWIRKTSSLSPIYKSSRVLLSWFAGKQALEIESLSEDEIISGFSATVSNMLPWNETNNGNSPEGTIIIPPKLDRVLRTQWGTNPLFRGSYSYVAMGSSADDMDTLAEPLPDDEKATRSPSAAPQLQILFAGEATHRTHYSTTHGAYFSGIREANRLLKHYVV